MGSAEVLEALYPLLLCRSEPEYLRSAQRPGVQLRSVHWLSRSCGNETEQDLSGSPWENGYNESFNGTLHRKILNAELVRNHKADSDCHQSMDTPIQPYPAALCPRHATASPRDDISDPSHH